MAIDTLAKRFSMLNFGDGNNFHLLPAPSGDFYRDDLLQLLDLYGGFVPSEHGGDSSKRGLQKSPLERLVEARKTQVIYEDEEILAIILTATRILE